MSDDESRSDFEDVSDPERPEPPIGDQYMPDVAPTQKKPKQKSSVAASLMAQTTGNTYEYKSNVFQMETEEMLSEVRLNYSKRMSAVEKTLHRLKVVIDGIRERRGLKISEVDAEMKKRKIYVPFPRPRPAQDIKWQFAYVKPSYINVAGSYALKTLIKQKEAGSIDVVLTMPADIFQEKDYLNYRYFHKRAYYLAIVAIAIADSKELKGLKVEYDCINGDHLRPILMISPSGDGSELDFSSSKCTINIIPSAPPDIFPPKKLHPLRNCVRPHRSTGLESTSRTYDPTPFYNASLAADMAYFPYMKLLHSSSSCSAAFVDACILGRIWLRQRGFGGSISKGGFGHFEWALLMSFLLKGGGPKGHGLLAAGYNNYQMFKATLQFLASRDLSNDPLVLGTSDSVNRPGARVPTVFDAERGVNLLFKMSSWGYNMLKHQAERTLACLNNNAITDQFEAVFIQREDEMLYKFDAIARLPIPLHGEHHSESSAGARNSDFAERIYSVLKEGLSDRVLLINLTLPAGKPLAIRGTPKPEQPRELIVGLLLNASTIARTADRGPSPEEKKKAAAFRRFWGTKAELRRFPDGTIIESVTWSTKGTKVPVYQQIIRHVLAQHFSDAVAESVSFVGESSSHLIEGGELGNGAFQPVYDGFDKLDRNLKSLTGIPLAIRHISAAGAALRASTVKLPLGPRHQLMEPADVVVQFESSSRWPDDLVAIQKTKISFLVRMGELLEQTISKELVTRVGLENYSNPIMNSAFLDVIYFSGAAFRIRIYHDRESTLLQNRCNDPTLALKSKEAALEAFSEHKRTFVLAPRQTNSIRQLCHRYPLLSPTIRLVKKWFHAQMFSLHVSDEFLELVAVRTFLYPYPWSAPSSIMTGFLRTIQFLSAWDWRLEPLIIDFSDGESMKAADFQQIRANFEATRKKDPAMNQVAIWVAYNHDRELSLFTQGKPAKVVAARITALAAAAEKAVVSAGLELEMAKFFVPEIKDYDFVLQLNPKWINLASSSRVQKPKSKFKNLQQDEEGIKPQDVARLSLDPVSVFVKEISDIYRNSILFFHGTEGVGAGYVGGVWCPHSSRHWKANLGYSSVPKKDEDSEEINATVNKTAILNEISRIGAELVSKVVVNRA